MEKVQENSNEAPSLDAEILLKEQDLKQIKSALAEMRKEIAGSKKRARIRKKELKQLRKEANASRKSYWQYILEHSKNQKDIALDGISGGLKQN